MKDYKAIELQLPLILLRTRKGLDLIERIAGWGWIRPLGWILLIIMPMAAAIGLFLILNAVGVYLMNPLARSFARGFTPLANILIPGLNPYLPLFYGWVALIIGLIVHEGCHAILARSMKLTVKSTGLLLFLGIPIGAFAEVDEKEIEKAPARRSTRVLAAGPGGNIIVAIVALAGLIFLVSTMAPVADGLGVYAVVQDYPIHKAGIVPGDIILKVNGKKASIASLTKAIMSSKPGDVVSFTVLRLDEDKSPSVLEFKVRLTHNPRNRSLPFAGLTVVDPAIILQEYQKLGFKSPLLYLIWPTLSTAQQRIPYSDTMHVFYTSPLGLFTQPLANLLFWIWFVNFNLAIFNALPIYPLDGGQAFKLTLRSLAKGRLDDKAVMRLTLGVTLAVVFLIASMLILPYLG